jgi:hypothetical protein
MTDELKQLLIFIEKHGGLLLHHKEYGYLVQAAVAREDALCAKLATTNERLAKAEAVCKALVRDREIDDFAYSEGDVDKVDEALEVWSEANNKEIK